MTKIEIIQTLDKVLSTETLDKFYSISITDYDCSRDGDRAALRIQADYTSDLVFKLNKVFNIDEEDADSPKWIVGNSGYLHLATKINGTPSRTVNLAITLA